MLLRWIREVKIEGLNNSCSVAESNQALVPIYAKDSSQGRWSQRLNIKILLCH